MDTNANSKILAALLSEAHAGFSGLIITKKGEVRGGKVYGNDRVQVTVISGFRYERLVQKSLDQLPSVDAQAVIEKLAEEGHTVTVADVEAARAELKKSFERTLAGTNESSTEHVFEPLVVNGETVRGSRVYKCVAGTVDIQTGQPLQCHCRECTGDPRAPQPGTIYLQGLQVYRKVLEPAANGPVPKANSKPKTLAKNAIRECLPVSRYVSYALEPGTDFILAAGGTAQVQAQANGFVVDDKVVQFIAKAV